MALTEQQIIDACERVRRGSPKPLDQMIVSQTQFQKYMDGVGPLYVLVDDIHDPPCRFETTERRDLE